MIFLIGLPCAQIILFCLAIGHYPKDLRFAVYNQEFSENECTMQNTRFLSCQFLNILKETQYKIVKYF